ncbi:small integral membrane protein 15 isoform X1 [Platichthys flesus]|nr:small integral membrane protein 15 isoform X1 [Platichthys flesus]
MVVFQAGSRGLSAVKGREGVGGGTYRYGAGHACPLQSLISHCGPAVRLIHTFPSRMIDVRAWAEYVVEWAAKDPYGFLTTVILALTPLFIASALLSWKLAKMIEVRDRDQKKKQKRQENIAKATKRTKKD